MMLGQRIALLTPSVANSLRDPADRSGTVGCSRMILMITRRPRWRAVDHTSKKSLA
jgi:hypothetical protein